MEVFPTWILIGAVFVLVSYLFVVMTVINFMSASIIHQALLLNIF